MYIVLNESDNSVRGADDNYNSIKVDLPMGVIYNADMILFRADNRPNQTYFYKDRVNGRSGWVDDNDVGVYDNDEKIAELYDRIAYSSDELREMERDLTEAAEDKAYLTDKVDKALDIILKASIKAWKQGYLSEVNDNDCPFEVANEEADEWVDILDDVERALNA